MTVVRSLSQAVRCRTRRLTGTALAALAVAAVTAGGAAAAVAPSNAVAPAITGTAAVGSTLTSSTGTWTGDAPITFAYQWQRCDATPSVCSAITGATAQTYVPVGADVGGRLLVGVTATNATGSVTSFSAATAIVPAVTAPANTVLPSIAGSAVVGSTLTGSIGTWTGTAPVTSVQAWQRCDAAGANCVAITGATALTYVPVAGDVGSTLRLSVTSTNTVSSLTVASLATVAVTAAAPAPAAPANTLLPSIAGSAGLGSTLSGSIGTWTGTAPVTSVQAWQRCDAAGANCVAITGATALTYVPVAGDVGSRLRLSVTSTNAVGSLTVASLTSAPVTATGVVTPPRGNACDRLLRGRHHVATSSGSSASA